jgi:ferredoxin
MCISCTDIASRFLNRTDLHEVLSEAVPKSEVWLDGVLLPRSCLWRHCAETPLCLKSVACSVGAVEIVEDSYRVEQSSDYVPTLTG